MAVCWFFFTWWTVVVPLLMVPLSLAAIALPVGKRRQPPPLQAQQHWNVQSAPGGPPQPLPPSPSPGWYRDPWSAGSRWWDGRCWTGYTSP
jgi:hypothetical protein